MLRFAQLPLESLRLLWAISPAVGRLLCPATSRALYPVVLRVAVSPAVLRALCSAARHEPCPVAHRGTDPPWRKMYPLRWRGFVLFADPSASGALRCLSLGRRALPGA